MMTVIPYVNIHYTPEEINYVITNYGIKSYKQISEDLGIALQRAESIGQNYIKSKYSRGTSPLSYRPKRVYNVNDLFFDRYSNLSCYWAGMLAADGNINQERSSITITLQRGDEDHIENFRKDLNIESPLIRGFSNYSYKGETTQKFYSGVRFTSEQIAKSLEINFNITPKKSLTLDRPNIENSHLQDCFILGYIDGDGSTFLGKGKRQRKLVISIIGTLSIVEWIQKRFGEILNEELKCIYKDKKHEGNTYFLKVSDKRARKIFLHFYGIDVPKLERKWSIEKYEHCMSFQKFQDREFYERIVIEKRNGGTNKEISERLGISPSLLSWYLRRDLFKELNESLWLNKGEVDIESDDATELEENT
jgi:hypothetical protein